MSGRVRDSGSGLVFTAMALEKFYRRVMEGPGLMRKAIVRAQKEVYKEDVTMFAAELHQSMFALSSTHCTNGPHDYMIV